jgi:hypothetical protein
MTQPRRSPVRKGIGTPIGIRGLAGVVVGLLSWVVVGSAILFVLRMLWTAYALAAPTKAYTVTMLLGRLTVAVADSATAGCVAARVGGPRAAWWLGILLVAFSTTVHLIIVWTDYPLWYHLGYLLPLVPVTGLAGRLCFGTRAS